MKMTLAASLYIGVAAALLTPGGRANAASAPDTQPGQTGTFKTGGDTITYRISGSGPAMLLIHGFPLSGLLFDGQVYALSQSFTVITPDLPGFGQSVTGTSAQTEEHYATDMIALLGHLGVQSAVIGGHSMGGQVTLEMYRLQPSLFTGMILFDTNPAAASIVEMAEWPAYGRMAEKLSVPSIVPPVTGVMVTGTSLRFGRNWEPSWRRS